MRLLLFVALKQVHQLIKFFPLLLGATTFYGFDHAVVGVVFQDFRLNLIESRLDCPELSQNVDAIALILDHPSNSAHLPLDARQPGKTVLVAWFHGISFFRSLLRDFKVESIGTITYPIGV